MHIIVVGCGRVGAELALAISRKGHNVEVIDDRVQSFDRLGTSFKGRTVQGSGIDRSVLLRAGIEKANAFATATSSDNINIISARIAKEIYHVPIVIARAYNPHQLPIYERFELQTVASSSWGARRMEELLTSPGCLSRLSLGNGEVEMIETQLPAIWDGKKIREVASALPALPVAITRAGRALLAGSELILQSGDLLHLAVPSENMARLNELLAGGRA